jgi:hypothetical protein
LNFFPFKKSILEFSLPDGSTSVHRGLVIVFIYGKVEKCFEMFLDELFGTSSFKERFSNFHYISLKEKRGIIKLSSKSAENNQAFFEDVYRDYKDNFMAHWTTFVTLYKQTRNAFAHGDDIKSLNITELDIQKCKHNAIQFIDFLEEYINSVANP